MLVEITREVSSLYRGWHEKHRFLSGLLLASLGLVVLQIAWTGLWWLASFMAPGQQRHAVAGRVTWQGQPLDNGIISFCPRADQPFESGAVILKGRFDIPREKGLTPGRYLVRIHASAPDPKYPPPAAGERDMRPGVEVLPGKYNANSELTAEIGNWGRTTVSFDLIP